LETSNILLTDFVTGAQDFTPEQDIQEIRQIEKQVKRRFAIGTQVILQ
jgi:hypothetical protein